MADKRQNLLILIVFFFALVLQVLTPFLHAHTGASVQSGLHLHLTSSSSISSSLSESQTFMTGSSIVESSEIGMPVSRNDDSADLNTFNLLIIVSIAFPLLLFFVKQRTTFELEKRATVSRFTQNSPPPALAPPVLL